MNRIRSSKLTLVQHSALSHMTCRAFSSKQRRNPNIFESTHRTSLNNIANTKHDQHDDNFLVLAQKTVTDRKKQRLARTFNRMSDFVTNLNKQPVEFVSLKKPLVNINDLKSKAANLFTNCDGKEFVRFENAFELMDEDKKREYNRMLLFNTCLSLEVPFHSEMLYQVTKECFLKPPKEWEKQLLSTSVSKKTIMFALNKWMKKNLASRKKSVKINVSLPNERPEFKRRYIPFFNVAYMHNALADRFHQLKQFNQPLVMDMRFHDKIDNGSCNMYQQLSAIASINRLSTNPFHMVLCNLNTDADLYHKYFFERIHRNVVDTLTTTNRSYTDMEPLIDRDSLVYLSPDAGTVMTEYSHDKVYIIGALVDKQVDKQLTKTVSTLEQINAVKLPLTQILKWGGVGGKQELSIDVVYKILYTLKETGDWVKAFRHIPYRLHKGLTEMGEELANYDSETIAYFNKGHEWYEKKKLLFKEPRNPRSPKNIMSRSKDYLGAM